MTKANSKTDLTVFIFDLTEKLVIVENQDKVEKRHYTLIFEGKTHVGEMQ